MLSTHVPPGAARVKTRYWLSKDGQAFMVEDHLQAAQYIKPSSDECDKPGSWRFEEMWGRGWARVRIEDGTIEVQIGPEQQLAADQSAWLNAAAASLRRQTGAEFAAIGWNKCSAASAHHPTRSAEPVPLMPWKPRPPRPHRTVEEALAQVQRLREQSSRRTGDTAGLQD